MTKTTYNTVIDSMYYKDIKNDKDEVTKTIPVYREELPKDIQEYLFNEIQREQAEADGIPFEQSYHIMYGALALFDGVDFEELEAFDPLECEDTASIYYVEQLSYLNTSNMYAIADLIRDYECTDVASACAIWYDSTVKDWALTIKNYILNN